jgi:pimeloyl-ACP methyl ester carboxylesterase
MATVILHALSSEPSDLPLVLLAPFPLDGRVWAGVASAVGGDVITVDPPGFGGQTDDDPGLEGYARAVLAALEARGVGRFVVAGNSMGGYAAMCLAELAPQRLAGIGLFGTKSTADAVQARVNRLAMAAAAESGRPLREVLAPLQADLLGASTRRLRPDADAELAALVAGATPEGVAWAQRAMAARPDRTAVLGALAVPAVVVHGAEDALMGADTQLMLGEALGVEVVEVPRCGHLVPFEAPDAAAAALRGLWAAAR